MKQCPCGKAVRKGGTKCSACYMRQYRQTINGQAATRRASRRWRVRHPNKAQYHDREYKREWRRRTHFYVPAELKCLRAAVRRLEAALAASEVRN